MLRMEDRIDSIPSAKLQAVVALERLALLHAFSVDEGSVLTALVFDEELTIFRDDQGVIAGNARIRNCKVLFDLPTDGEGAVIEIKGAFLVTVDELDARKYPRTDPPGNRPDDGLSSHCELCCAQA